jgi:hypothetical protein
LTSKLPSVRINPLEAPVWSCLLRSQHLCLR